jgi:hypothetical protein
MPRSTVQGNLDDDAHKNGRDEVIAIAAIVFLDID